MSTESLETSQSLTRPVESERGLLLAVLLMVVLGVGAILLIS